MPAPPFTVVKRLSQGPSAEVYLARAGRREVLLKKAPPAAARVEAFRQAFLDEARVAASLSHHNIAKVLDSGDDAGIPWIATEHVPGKSLREIAALGPIPLALALRIVADAARGLHYAHEREDDQGWPLGILHRDVCPANILVGFDGVTRVTDFGLIRAASALPQVSPELLAEKLGYSSPELLCGAPVDHRSDLFSLAVVLYEITLRRPPFLAAKVPDLMRAIVDCRPDPPESVDPRYPPELERVLMRALQRLPDERPQTCRGFAKSLEDVLERLGLTAGENDVGAWLRAKFDAELPEEREESEPMLLLEVSSPDLTPDEKTPPPAISLVPPPPPAETLDEERPLPEIPAWGEAVMEQARAGAVPPPLPAVGMSATREAAQAAARAAAARAAAKQAAADKSAADRAALEQARAAAEAARESQAGIERDRDALRESADAAQRRIAQLARELEEARRETETARREIALSQAAADAGARAALEAREEAAKLSAQLDAARRDQELLSVAADHAQTEAAAARARAEEAEKAAADARRELEDATAREGEANRDTRTAAMRLAAARRDAHEASERETEARAEADAAREALEAARRDLAAAEASMRAEIAARELEARSQVASRDEAVVAVREAARVEVEAAAAREAAARARAEAAQAELDAFTEAVQGKTAALQDEIAALRAELAKQQSEAEAREDVAVKAAGAAKREALLAREESDRLRHAAQSAVRDRNEAQQERDAARRQAAEAAAAAESARADAERAAREQRQWQRAAEAARAAEEAAQRASAVAVRDAEASRTEADQARADAAAARAEARDARREAEAAVAALTAALGDAEARRQEAEAARGDAEAARREAESVHAAAAVAPAPRPEPLGPVAEEPDLVRHESGLTRYSQVELYLMSFADAPRSNVTTDPGLFAGREDEIREMDLLAHTDEPVVTLVGAEGSGRTRLARRYGSLRLVELSSAGGVWYADLSAARNTEGICLAVATALSVPLDPAVNAAATVKNLGHALAARGRLLLILDDVDAIRPAIAGVLVKWMSVATQAKFLLTARAAVGAPGERVCAVGGLSGPDAMRLFVERLRARKREADLKAPGAKEDIESLIAQLGGHPLAVEIAASFTDRVSPAALRDELAGRAPGSILPAVLDACAKRLESWELEALQQLAVFAAGFTVDLAAEVLTLGGDPAASAPGAIRTLRSRSLLRSWEPPDLPGETRLAIHPAIRAWASARLAASGNATATEIRHADAVSRTAETLAARAGADPLAPRRLALLVPELAAAWERFSPAAPRDHAAAVRSLRAVAALGPVLPLLGTATAVGWLETALPLAREAAAEPRLLASAEMWRSRLRREQGYASATHDGLAAAVATARETGDRTLEALALAEQSRSLRADRRAGEARAALDAAIRLARRAKDRPLEARLLSDLGALAASQLDPAFALACFEEALTLTSQLGLLALEGEILASIGAILQSQDRGEALGFFERALALHQEVRNRAFEASTVGRLAAANLDAGRLAEARKLFERGIQIHGEMGDRRGEADLRGALGVVELLDGKVEEARASLVRAVWMLGDTGDPKREALYLAHLGAVEAARGKLPTATSSFDLARKRLAVEKDPDGLAAVEVLSGTLDLARAAVGEPTGRSAAESKLSAADARIAPVRLARKVLEQALKLPARPASASG